MKNKVKKIFAILTMCIMLSCAVCSTEESICIVDGETIADGERLY